MGFLIIFAIICLALVIKFLEDVSEMVKKDGWPSTIIAFIVAGGVWWWLLSIL